ncbi:MAG: hypothetical protein HXY49_09370 [Ignavibacteriaceae bacterium]|nr:hypothetical protein [Ignavibacteriaceae bacterium]
MKKIILLLSLCVFIASSCNEEDPTGGVIDSKITAKEKMNEVLQKAKQDFSSDAEISAVYGWNVALNGEIDLLNTNNAFVYIVQSDQKQSNEFYVPVFAAGPVKSPINFNTMLGLVKDTTASNVLGKVFGKLATISIDPNANYSDSPQAIQVALNNGGNNFITQHSGVKVDMFLVPSKSIDSTSVINSADWIINFYSSSKSLVL